MTLEELYAEKGKIVTQGELLQIRLRNINEQISGILNTMQAKPDKGKKMGQVSTEQTVRIIEAVGDAVEAQPQPVSEPNYWWLLMLAIIPVFLTWWLNRKRK